MHQERAKRAEHLSSHNITIFVRGLAAGHQPITQLNNFRHADDGLGMVALVRQQHQEVEDLWDKHLGIQNLALFDELELLDDEANENLVRVE